MRFIWKVWVFSLDVPLPIIDSVFGEQKEIDDPLAVRCVEILTSKRKTGQFEGLSTANCSREMFAGALISQMQKPNLSIILPVHNEVASLERVIVEWDASLRKIPGLVHLFIICEDGSSDGTKELIIELSRRYSIRNNSVSWRRGYGQAVRDGIGLAESDYVLCIDSDGQIGPDQMNEVWTRRSNDQFLMGWRHPRRDPSVRLIYSQLFKLYHGVLFPNRLHDPSCPFVLGHTKLFERVAPLLVYMEEGFWWGFVGACWKLKVPIEEIRIRHRERFADETQVYRLTNMPGIIFRNSIGLLKLRLA